MNPDLWIKEVMKTLNRNRTEILFSEHAAKDKNMNMEDVGNAVKTVKTGKVACEKSTKEKGRICFKNYFKNNGATYFVVVEYHPDHIKIITVNKKKGKY